MNYDLDDLKTPTQIAQTVGVVPSTVVTWALRYPDYPPMIRKFGTSPLRSEREVLAWCRRTGRLEKQEGRIYDSEGFDVTDQYKKKGA